MTTLSFKSYLEDFSSSKHSTLSLDQLVDIWFFRVVILSILGCGPRISEGSWKPLKRQGLCFLTYLCDFLHVLQRRTYSLNLEANMKVQLSSVISDIRRFAKMKNNVAPHKIVFMLEYIVIFH